MYFIFLALSVFLLNPSAEAKIVYQLKEEKAPLKERIHFRRIEKAKRVDSRKAALTALCKRAESLTPVSAQFLARVSFKEVDESLQIFELDCLAKVSKIPQSALQYLIQTAKDSDSQVRYKAVQIMGRNELVGNNSQVVETIIELLSSESYRDVKQQVLQVLQGYLNHGFAVNRIIDGLMLSLKKDTDNDYRIMLSKVLNNNRFVVLNFPQSKEYLITTTLFDKNASVREYVIRILDSNSKYSLEEVDLFIAALSSDSSATNRTLLVNLLAIQSGSKTEIRQAFFDQSIKEDNAEIINRMISFITSVKPLSDDEVVKLLTNKYTFSNYSTLISKLQSGPDLSDKLFDAIISTAKQTSGSEPYFSNILSLLSAKGKNHELVRDYFVSLITNSSYSNTVFAFFQTVKDISSKHAVMILSNMKSLSWQNRRAFVGIIGSQNTIDFETAKAMFLVMTTDSDSDVRSSAREALKKTNLASSKESVPFFIDQILGSNDSSIIDASVGVLINFVPLSNAELEKLSNKLKDTSSYSTSLIGLIAKHQQLSNLVVQNLIFRIAISSTDSSKIIEILKSCGTFSDQNMLALFSMLPDGNNYIRPGTIFDILKSQPQMKYMFISMLIGMLGKSNSDETKIQIMNVLKNYKNLTIEDIDILKAYIVYSREDVAVAAINSLAGQSNLSVDEYPTMLGIMNYGNRSSVSAAIAAFFIPITDLGVNEVWALIYGLNSNSNSTTRLNCAIALNSQTVKTKYITDAIRNAATKDSDSTNRNLLSFMTGFNQAQLVSSNTSIFLSMLTSTYQNKIITPSLALYFLTFYAGTISQMEDTIPYLNEVFTNNYSSSKYMFITDAYFKMVPSSLTGVNHLNQVRQLAVDICSSFRDYCNTREQIHAFPRLKELDDTIMYKKLYIDRNGSNNNTVKLFDKMIEELNLFFSEGINYQNIRGFLPKEMMADFDPILLNSDPDMLKSTELIVKISKLLEANKSNLAWVSTYARPVTALKLGLVSYYKKQFWKINFKNSDTKAIATSLVQISRSLDLLKNLEANELTDKIGSLPQTGMNVELSTILKRGQDWQVDRMGKSFNQVVIDWGVMNPSAVNIDKNIKTLNDELIRTSIAAEWDKLILELNSPSSSR